jgi:transposase
MRKDIAKSLSKYTGEEMKLINKSEMARRLGCDRRTVSRYMENKDETEIKKERPKRAKLMDNYGEIAKEKVDKHGVTAMAVYKFIKKKGYIGEYCTVANYIREHKSAERKKAVIRFETMPGLQAQIDWKESVKMINRQGSKLEVNIFLMVLGYSRLKFIKLTMDRKQDTLFECLIEAFLFIAGIPHELLLDNMPTVIDRARTTYTQAVFNSRFEYFANDAGFDPIACRAYRAKTKGKVEALSRLVGRLKVYNEEFDTYEELEAITNEFMKDINEEVSQATGEVPNMRFEKEKEYLRPLPCTRMLSAYISNHKDYTVSHESMIKYKGGKYSVPTYYIGKEVEVKENDDRIDIVYDQDIISSFDLSEKKLNYKHEHVREILASDALAHLGAADIDEFIKNNLSTMDILLD